MRRCRVAVLFLAGSLALASADAMQPAGRAAPRAAPRERSVPFKAGETLTYDVSWSSYVTAGTATMRVVEKRSSFGSTAYYIVAEARPSPLLGRLYTLYYKADTLLDSYTLLPQRGSIYSEEGRRRRFKVTRFDQARRQAQFEMRTASVIRTDHSLAADTQDPLSAIYALRTMRPEAGVRTTIPIADGGRIYRVAVTYGQRERVTTGIGEISAWQITPVIFDDRKQVPARRLWLWLSDDARRLPVKLQVDLPVGSFQLVLRDVRG